MSTAPDTAKRLATLKAECALAGVALIESTDDRDRPVFIVSRWSMTRQLDDLDHVAAWLSRVTGSAVE